MADKRPDQHDDFSAGLSAKRSGGTGELWAFLKDNKKWWLLPILVAVVLLGALVVLGGTAAAPFIYTLF